MTPRSAVLPRIILPPCLLALVALAIVAPLPALAQPTSAQTMPAQTASPGAPPSQARPSQPSSTQGNPSQGATPPAGAAATPPAAPAPTQSTAPTAAPAYIGPAYNIEIVIFRARAALGQPESWAAENTASATVAGGEASSGSGSVGKLLGVLPTSDYRLTSIASRLRTSGTYVPVAHAAWVQTASAWGTHAGFPLESLGINVPGLTGNVFLERGQYLHLGMTLNYTMQDPPPGLDAPPGTTFVMNETRRVRFYQRNYYDHPAFGVIALITPARGPRPPGR